MRCKCGSYAINPQHHGRDGSDNDLCDVCYWRKRAERYAALLTEIGHYAHDHSTGPAVPDALWTIRGMAYDG